MFCKNCGTQVADGTPVCPSCGAPMEAPQPAQQWQGQPVQQNQLPMNWYKFLVYFALWASAVSYVITGILLMTGGIYGGTGELVYYVYPALKIVNIIFGIVFIALAAFSVYVALQLKGFKKDAPNKLLLLYLAALIVSILYTIVNLIIVKSLSGASSIIVSIIVSIVMIILNKIYFDKRKHLFVN